MNSSYDFLFCGFSFYTFYTFYYLERWKEDVKEFPNLIRLFLISISLLFYLGKFEGISIIFF